MRRLLGSLTALLCLGAAAPAHADQVTVRDGVGDVSQTRVGDSVFVYQSDVREGDFVRTTFRHGARNVVVTSLFRDLARVGDHHGYFVRLESGRHRYRDVAVEAGPGLWRGQHVMTDRRGERVRCGVRHSIDYDRDVVRIVVPRACLGGPQLVRGTAAAAWTQPDPDDPSQPGYLQLDNPHDDEAETDAWTRWIAHT